MSKASTIRPGLLVGLKSTVVGGVSYKRTDLDAGETEDGKAVAKWETERVIEDEDEYKAASKCRSKALAAITKVCSSTPFGYLCPEDREGALDAAVASAQALVEAHNAAATHTKIGIYVLKGRVASNDAEAARAITQELAELVARMDAGIKSFDPKEIRAAANRARELSGMLSEEKVAKIDAAIEQARKAARTIVRRIEVEGEQRETVLLDIQRGQIESARIAFLDLSAADGEQAPIPTSAPAPARQLDIEDALQENDLLGAARAVKETLVADGIEVDAVAWIAERNREREEDRIAEERYNLTTEAT